MRRIQSEFKGKPLKSVFFFPTERNDTELTDAGHASACQAPDPDLPLQISTTRHVPTANEQGSGEACKATDPLPPKAILYEHAGKAVRIG